MASVDRTRKSIHKRILTFPSYHTTLPVASALCTTNRQTPVLYWVSPGFSALTGSLLTVDVLHRQESKLRARHWNTANAESGTGSRIVARFRNLLLQNASYIQPNPLPAVETKTKWTSTRAETSWIKMVLCGRLNETKFPSDNSNLLYSRFGRVSTYKKEKGNERKACALSKI